MNKLRALFTRSVRVTKSVNQIPNTLRIQNRRHHEEEWPPLPFDNMPFRVTNRYVATAFFSVFFGLGLWAPFIILWYAMAKKAL